MHLASRAVSDKQLEHSDHRKLGHIFSSIKPPKLQTGFEKIKKINSDKAQTKIKVVKNSVAIVLGYYNGQKYIAEQLDSILNQTHSSLHVFLSDDASNIPFNFSDQNLDIKETKRLTIGTRAKNIGFSNNFLLALQDIDSSFDYYAFSDQDDVWYEKKIEKALEHLSGFSDDMPALYCARTEITDADCKNTISFSPCFSKSPSFANALVQNIGGGNTMVFNKAARDLIVNTISGATVVSHDWWSYQIISGAGGCIIYDKIPCLKYRQHSSNIVGENSGWKARIFRIRTLLQGGFRKWIDINLEALIANKHLLTKQNQEVLATFIEARQSSLFQRLALFKRAGIYRQSFLGNLGLLVGILFNRV